MPIPSNYNRRCRNHDYRAPWIYMITLLKSAGIPALSAIRKDEKCKKISPIVDISPAGGIIGEELLKLEKDFPQLKILCKIIMPDHVHFEVYVRSRLERHLGFLIGRFKSNCSKRWWEITGIGSSTETPSLFQPGFNDKIAFKAGMKDAFYRYIDDNPRRYLVKKLLPEYFYHKTMIEIAGRRWGLYGNLWLLDTPVKSWVKISRIKERTPNLPYRIKEWEETIRCGGTLVSAFINPEEKHYRDMAIRDEACLILVVDYRFSDRQKPYKELFNLCGEGRLLIVSSEKYDRPPKKITHAEAEVLNECAKRISELAPGSALLRARSS